MCTEFNVFHLPFICNITQYYSRYCGLKSHLFCEAPLEIK